MTQPAAVSGQPSLSGIARVDRRTKALVSRLQPGDIAVIDHEDLDGVAAETLVGARPAAVVNASSSMTGRYPNIGPLALTEAGIPLIDAAGAEVMAIEEGSRITIQDGTILLGDDEIATGERQTHEGLQDRILAAKSTMGAELERFAENTLRYIQAEGHLLVDEPDVPEVPGVDFRGRHVLIVVRGVGYKDDLNLLRRSGYIADQKPILIAVDGGADALLEAGRKPDVIIGDMDSVSEEALRCGARLIVHGYRDGRAPGGERLDGLGLDYEVYGSEGTSEDIAMLLSYEKGCELIVAVGTHNSMVEFLDKGRAGMASTFLVRMKVGMMLVDAKGVSRLYRSTVRTRDLLLLVLAAVFTMVVIVLVSEPIRLVIRTYWVSFTS
ncbi:putative cytokinetic ring protein SteA [Acidimicrobiia bacterium EGI L10123]|uniref:putative cytokinetic ring protein SteA n=1 Tax=Salinilacustrithrix flava TaxID=2957203 RepID=UPI003D7C21B9|nr:putative cytokinetic ring protein SteA [Acidimicrobiia bacterium EGI L10123]